MKTIKILKTCALTLFLLFFSLKTLAQCPTIPIANVSICDASGFNFSDLNAFATDTGDGIVWYGSIAGTDQFTAGELVSEGTYFADNNTGNCATRNPITVTFDVSPSGQNLDGIFCSNENATIQTYINEVLMPNIPTGGSVEIFTDFALTIQANSTDVLSANTNYFIIFIDNLGCRSQIEFGSTAVFPSPTTPIPPTPQQFCSDTNPTIGDLDPGTTDNFSWYANINATGDPIPPALPASFPLVDGATYHVQANNFFCDSDTAPVMVEIDDPADAGDPGNLDFCEINVPTTDIDLFNELGGTPENTGAWTGPLTTTNGHLGTVNITGLTDGVYVLTYTVPGLNACPDATATVTITIYENLDSGNALALISFCEADAPAAFDLNSLLENEDPNGQWTQGTASTDPVVTSPIDLTTFTPGIYNFTYTQNVAPNPCPENTETVQVEILADPNAGTAINDEFCENDLTPNPYDLFTALDGTQDNNLGTWTDASGATVTNPIDISIFTVANSPYIFTYTINNGTCTNDEAITLTVLPAPESGAYIGTPLEICEDAVPANSPYDLFNLLDGTQDTNGTWYSGNNTTGAIVTNPIDLTTLGTGSFNFTYDVPPVGTCTDSPVTVEVIINDLPNTGTATPVTFCENDLAANSPLDLFNQLTGETPGGTWNDDNTTGALTGSSVDLTLLTIGTYSFTYSLTDFNTCTNNSTVIINVVDAPESGAYIGTPLEICEDAVPANSPYDLFNLLDGTQDTNGTWYSGNTTSGAIVTSPIDLATLGTGSFNFTYDVPAIGTCTDTPVTIEIIINELPISGTATPFVVCENDLATNSPLDLFNQLTGETTGGTWNDDNATGALTGSSVDLTALTVGSYNFTYSLTNANSCSSSSTVTITIEEEPEAGTATNIAFCFIDITPTSTLDLFTQLAGNDTGGTWNDDDTSGALTGSTVDLTLLANNTTYNFTYTVIGIGTCVDDTETVSVLINETTAPTANANQEFCDSATVANLIPNGTNIQWYDDATLGAPLASTTVLVDGETYYASQSDTTTSCESSLRTEVIATIHISPISGVATDETVCDTESAFDLFTTLDGSQDTGGTWNDDNTTGALVGSVFDATTSGTGTFSFTYTVTANAPCLDASTTVNITVENPVTSGAVINPTIELCSTDGSFDLFSNITGQSAGGSWSVDGTPVASPIDPATAASGTYAYTVASACNFTSTSYSINITPAANAGLDNTIAFCIADGTVDLLTELGGAPDTTGTWSPLLDSGTNIFDPNIDLAGVYTYTVVATSPCTIDASAQLTITINNTTAPTSTTSNADFCVIDNATVASLNVFVTGTSIQWYDTVTSTTALNNTDLLIDGEDYYATQTDGTTLCASTLRTLINVTVSDAPTPTLIPNGNSFCINDNPTILTITNSIVEFLNATNDVVWYTDLVGGVLVNSAELLVDGQTYYAALIDPISLCESSVRLPVTVDLSACGEIDIPDGFSPNGDGVNDTFTINNLEFLYPNYELEFYNRYGNIVFKTKASQEDFAGKSNQSRLINKGDLPVGVYYYIINFNDGTTPTKQGSFYLNR